MSEKAGAATAEEIAPVCAGVRPAETLDSIETLAGSGGTEAHFVLPVSLPVFPPGGSASPWQRGKHLAGELRRQYDLGSQPVSDRKLAEILGIPAQVLQAGHAESSRRPLGLAVRNGENGRLKLLFRKRNRPALRFEAMRFLGDQISTPMQERWLPVTDTGTARQKLQRAFAIEFLCPISGLTEYLNDDFSPEAVEEAGEYFGVSELAVKSHLANHGKIPSEAVTV